jgi:hypothetical protein
MRRAARPRGGLAALPTSLVGLGAALAGCGHKPAPPPRPGPKVSPSLVTRRPITDDPGERDDGLEVSSGKGHVEPARVEAGLAPIRDALSRCYPDRVGKRRWLAGHLALRWEVAADGAIARVLLTESDLGAWPIEQCVLAAARQAHFGAPIGGPAEVSLPLAFSLCTARAAGGCAGGAVVWDDEHSVRAVGRQLARLDACAAAGAMPGDVQITIYAGLHGRPASVGFASAVSELGDAWTACAASAVLAWHLPDPKGQVAKLAVRYRPR